MLLEMFQIPEWSLPAIEAGLPVWLGMSCGPRGATGDVMMCSWPDKPFRDSVESLIRPNLAAVCIMHSEVTDVGAGLELVRTKWHGPLGAYAHSGGHVHPKWLFENIITPEEYVAKAEVWKGYSSVSIIGGCCGLQPDRIRELKSHFG